jgi:hypothetical protein
VTVTSLGPGETTEVEFLLQCWSEWYVEGATSLPEMEFRVVVIHDGVSDLRIPLCNNLVVPNIVVQGVPPNVILNSLMVGPEGAPEEILCGGDVDFFISPREPHPEYADGCKYPLDDADAARAYKVYELLAEIREINGGYTGPQFGEITTPFGLQTTTYGDIWFTMYPPELPPDWVCNTCNCVDPIPFFQYGPPNAGLANIDGAVYSDWHGVEIHIDVFAEKEGQRYPVLGLIEFNTAGFPGAPCRVHTLAASYFSEDDLTPSERIFDDTAPVTTSSPYWGCSDSNHTNPSGALHINTNNGWHTGYDAEPRAATPTWGDPVIAETGSGINPPYELLNKSGIAFFCRPSWPGLCDNPNPPTGWESDLLGRWDECEGAPFVGDLIAYGYYPRRNLMYGYDYFQIRMKFMIPEAIPAIGDVDLVGENLQYEVQQWVWYVETDPASTEVGQLNLVEKKVLGSGILGEIFGQ